VRESYPALTHAKWRNRATMNSEVTVTIWVI